MKKHKKKPAVPPTDPVPVEEPVEITPRDKIAKDIGAICREMDNKCEALEWLEQLRREIDFCVEVVKDDLKIAGKDYGGV